MASGANNLALLDSETTVKAFLDFTFAIAKVRQI
jgi:hypothetical protein